MSRALLCEPRLNSYADMLAALIQLSPTLNFAESQIMHRLTAQSERSSLKARVEQEVFRLGSIGLRTLCFAMRELSDEELVQTDWINEAKSVLCNLCEKDLILVGCTGVQDELQDDVNDCIQDFKDAGIKVWMLTGDSGQTAEAIGYNCGLVQRDENQSNIFKLEGADINQISVAVS